MNDTIKSVYVYMIKIKPLLSIEEDVCIEDYVSIEKCIKAIEFHMKYNYTVTEDQYG